MSSRYPELQKKALEHYDRMIRFVESVPAGEVVYVAEMLLSIKEDWYSSFCPYCQTLYSKEVGCTNCPLNGELTEDEEENCCNGLWYKLSDTMEKDRCLFWLREIRNYIERNG